MYNVLCEISFAFIFFSLFLLSNFPVFHGAKIGISIYALSPFSRFFKFINYPNDVFIFLWVNKIVVEISSLLEMLLQCSIHVSYNIGKDSVVRFAWEISSAYIPIRDQIFNNSK